MQARLLKRMRAPSDTYPNPSVQNFIFDLTARGHALYKPPGALGSGSPGGFCAGHLRVVSVDQFTSPVVAGGRRVSQVTFTAQADVDDWTRQPAVVAAFHQEPQRTQPFQQIPPMVQTSNGRAIDMSAPASDASEN